MAKFKCGLCKEGVVSEMGGKGRCYECKKLFCYDHLWGGQVNKTMRSTSKTRDICDKCRKDHGYKTVSED